MFGSGLQQPSPKGTAVRPTMDTQRSNQYNNGGIYSNKSITVGRVRAMAPAVDIHGAIDPYCGHDCFVDSASSWLRRRGPYCSYSKDGRAGVPKVTSASKTNSGTFRTVQ